MKGKCFAALCAVGLAGAATISSSPAAADNADALTLLPIGRILLQEALAAETAGKPRRDATGRGWSSPRSKM